MKDWPSIWWEPSWEDCNENIDELELLALDDDELDELPFE